MSKKDFLTYKIAKANYERLVFSLEELIITKLQPQEASGYLEILDMTKKTYTLSQAFPFGMLLMDITGQTSAVKPFQVNTWVKRAFKLERRLSSGVFSVCH